MNVNIQHDFAVDDFDVIASKILEKRDLPEVRHSVIRLIDYISQRKDLIDKIFRHPLGFLDFPISMIYNTRYKMRLHFWTAARDEDIISNIHFHTADILSYVLSGSIQDEQFYLLGGDPNPSHDVLRVEYYEGGSRRVPTGTSGIPVVDRTQLTSREGVYFVPRSVFHRSTVKRGEMTVTLMISFNEDPTMSHHALIEKDAADDLDFKHVRDVDSQSILELLQKAKHIIGKETH